MIRRLFISILCAAGAIASVFAQTSVEISLPRTAYTGQPFTIAVTVNNPDGNITKPQMPQLSGCELVGGPALSTASSVSIINGRRQSSERRSYTYTYLSDTEGTVKVPAIDVNVGGKVYSTRPGQFTISDGGSQGGNPYNNGGGYGYPRQSSPTPESNAGEFKIGPNDLFMRIAVSSSSVYEQQPVECTVKLYSSNQQIENLMAKSLPTFDGCLIELLPMPESISWVPEQINGRTIYSAVVYRALLYPQRAGELTLKGGEYTATAYRQVYVQDFMMYRPVLETKDVTLEPRENKIKVKALPQPQPADFSGAVGRFKASAELVGDSFKSNEAASVVYTIEGTGNVKFFTAPKIDFPSEFEVYEPNVTTDARVSGTNMTGTQRIEYTFVPQSPGDYTIGAYNFVYFDPSSGKYVTDTVDGFALKVEKGAGVSSSVPGVNKQDIEAKNTDIHHIKPGADKPAKVPDYIAGKAIYWAMYPILLIVFLLLSLLYYRRRQADPTGRKLKGAGKVARKRLSKAGKFLRAKHYDAYYEELLRAMQSYMSDKLQIPASQLSRDNILDTLSQRGASEELLQSIVHILNDCEMARYTPQTSGAAEATYTSARNAIDAIEHLKS